MGLLRLNPSKKKWCGPRRKKGAAGEKKVPGLVKLQKLLGDAIKDREALVRVARAGIDSPKLAREASKLGLKVRRDSAKLKQFVESTVDKLDETVFGQSIKAKKKRTGSKMPTVDALDPKLFMFDLSDFDPKKAN
jgi:hypothetical protein